MFTREELRKIREKAEEMSDIEGQNPFWSAAYHGLALSADWLDAMLARRTVEKSSDESSQIDSGD